MKNIIHKILLQEALKPSQFRKYVKAFNRERYNEIFKSLGNKYEHDRNYYRIYIPLGKEEKSGPISNVEKEVTDFLTQNGYQVLDYVKGIAKFGEAKNTTTIGRVLTRLKADDLMKKFVSDESRKALTSDAESLMVVISRHPYDIAGSDTDRNWTNCMTLGHAGSERVEKIQTEINALKQKLRDMTKDIPKQVLDNLSWDSPEIKLERKIFELQDELDNRKQRGENTKYLIHDVKEGSLISYLIKKTDKNINNPLAVLNIKPYINEVDSNDFVLVSDNNMYGNGRPEFKKVVESVLSEINGPKAGFYCLNPKVYSDNLGYAGEKVRFLKPEEKDFYLNKAKEFVNTITKGQEIPCYTERELKDIARYYREDELVDFYSDVKKQKCYLYRDRRNHRVLDLSINDAELKMINQFRTGIAVESVTQFKWFKNPDLPDDITAKAPYKIVKGVTKNTRYGDLQSGVGLFDNESYLNKILYSKEFLDFLRQKFHLDPNTKINHVYEPVSSTESKLGPRIIRNQ